jgi:kinesin family protein 3/17
MAAAKGQTSSALSASSKEIDRQLDDLMVDADVDADIDGDANTAKPSGRQDGPEQGENVVVMVRCRPLFAGERQQQRQAAVLVDENDHCVQVAGERRFYFDQVFGPDTSNEQVYMRSARRLVEFAFRGYNCTIFLYGQTGTGKTYTHSSLTLGAFEHLFSLIQNSNKQARFLIRASYYELYNEEIRDLLAMPAAAGGDGRRRAKRTSGGGSSRPALELHESKERGVYIKDLTCFLVNNLNELVKLKQLGDKRRATAATKMNEHSSRSHSIFSIAIETIANEIAVGSGSQQRPTTTTKTGAKSSSSSSGQSSLRLGRLHLIDLAGSERQSKSESSGVQLREASQINLSLTCLSLVIRALTDKTSNTGHIPYRNSKLTRLLSSSLGGNSKTLLMACISPAQASLDETMNTLRFASRTKRIKNKAVINEDPKDALLRKYRRQLNELREKLNQTQRQQQQQQRQDSSGHGQLPPAGPQIELDDQNRQQQQQQQSQLTKELELLKAKIMFGGENLLDKVELHERLLQASQKELEERQKAEAKLREELQSREHSFKNVVHSKGSLEGQRLYLEEKLAKAVNLHKRSKLELRDLSSEHEQIKEQLLQTIRSTSKEIKYIDCILDDFIPRKCLVLVCQMAWPRKPLLLLLFRA